MTSSSQVPANAILSAEDVSKEFMQGTSVLRILNHLNFNLAARELVAIIGQSGSGKSTLLAIMAGLDRPTMGKIKLAGHDLGGLDESALSRLRSAHMGIVFQQFHLIPNLTAIENVSLPLEIRRLANFEARAKDLLARVGLQDRMYHYAHQLSGGECQRVAIARALAPKPVVLLADEPTGNLDAKTGDQVIEVLFSAARDEGAGLVIVTHNESLAKRCSRQLVLRDGALQS